MGGKVVSSVRRFAKITWNAEFKVRTFPFDSHALKMILDYGGPRAHIEGGLWLQPLLRPTRGAVDH